MGAGGGLFNGTGASFAYDSIEFLAVLNASGAGPGGAGQGAQLYTWNDDSHRFDLVPTV